VLPRAFATPRQRPLKARAKTLPIFARLDTLLFLLATLIIVIAKQLRRWQARRLGKSEYF
jgi:hypothetical protein